MVIDYLPQFNTRQYLTFCVCESRILSVHVIHICFFDFIDNPQAAAPVHEWKDEGHEVHELMSLSLNKTDIKSEIYNPSAGQ